MPRGLHRVLGIDRLTDDTISLRLSRDGVEFVPGQCFNVGVPETAVNREYSSYSGMNDPELQFLIRIIAGGEVSQRLSRVKAGDLIEVDGAYGLFVIDPSLVPTTDFCFIGTGTGIAPFHCFVKSYPRLRYRIIHGTRYGAEAYNRSDYAPGSLVNCTSRDSKGDFQGRVTDYLQVQPLATAAYYYLCGNRNMINDVYDILRAKDISSSQIITEVFF